MTGLINLAADLQEFFAGKKWKFCFIGGLALQHWGEPRLTRDVDVTLLTGWDNEAAYIDALLERYRPRINDAKGFALRSRTLLLKSDDNIGIDIALAGLPFEETAIERACRIEYLPGIQLLICSPEDLMVMKAFANRPRDWLDIESIIERQGKAALDWDYVLRQIEPLSAAKELPEIHEKIRRLGPADK